MKNVHTNCKEELSFQLANGSTMRSIADLSAHLESMDHSIFAHHVTEERNDFSAWIKDVHKDQKLSELLQNTSEKTAAQIVVLKHMVDALSKPASKKRAAKTKKKK